MCTLQLAELGNKSKEDSHLIFFASSSVYWLCVILLKFSIFYTCTNIEACFTPWQDEQGDQPESVWLWKSSQELLHHQRNQKPDNYNNHRLINWLVLHYYTVIRGKMSKWSSTVKNKLFPECMRMVLCNNVRFQTKMHPRSRLWKSQGGMVSQRPKRLLYNKGKSIPKLISSKIGLWGLKPQNHPWEGCWCFLEQHYMVVIFSALLFHQPPELQSFPPL